VPARALCAWRISSARVMPRYKEAKKLFAVHQDPKEIYAEVIVPVSLSKN